MYSLLILFVSIKHVDVMKYQFLFLFFRLRKIQNIELTWNNMMEPSDSLTENESSTTLEDFLVISSSELQYYLQQQGLSVLGTHSSLATRALIAFEQKVEIKSTADQIAKQLKNIYRELLMKHNLDDSLLSSNFQFSIDIKCFLATHVGQIFNSILKTKAFEAEYIGQYKVKKQTHFLNLEWLEKFMCASLKTVK